MNWRKLTKALAVSFVSIVLTLLMLLLWGLSKLPSSFEIKQAITPRALQNTSSQSKGFQVSPDLSKKEDELSEVRPTKDPQDKIKSTVLKVLTEDLMDTRKPLSDICRDLEAAVESEFLRDSQNASAKYFFMSLAEEKKDPLVGSAAPILRYIFRAPGIQSVVETIQRSEESQDQSLLNKAEFYYDLFRAGDFLKSHTQEMDLVLQKSYNLHHLARAVAKQPELLKKSSVKTMCEELEKNINFGDEFDADLVAQQMLEFFADSGMDPKAVGFDPSYRSKVKVSISNSHLGIDDTWLVQLFARDIEKAQNAPSQK